MTASLDLQAVLYSPLLHYHQIYYKRKFLTFSFTVFIMNKKEGHCYMWDETEGRKGAIEIATCLQKFIHEEVPDGVKTLNLWCDDCPTKIFLLFLQGYRLKY